MYLKFQSGRLFSLCAKQLIDVKPNCPSDIDRYSKSQATIFGIERRPEGTRAEAWRHYTCIKRWVKIRPTFGHHRPPCFALSETPCPRCRVPSSSVGWLGVAFCSRSPGRCLFAVSPKAVGRQCAHCRLSGQENEPPGWAESGTTDSGTIGPESALCVPA